GGGGRAEVEGLTERTKKERKTIPNSNPAPPGGQEEHERGFIEDGLVYEPIDCRAEYAGTQCGGKESESQAARVSCNKHADIGPESEHGGLCDVQNPQQSVNQGEAERHERVAASPDESHREEVYVVHQPSGAPGYRVGGASSRGLSIVAKWWNAPCRTISIWAALRISPRLLNAILPVATSKSLIAAIASRTVAGSSVPALRSPSAATMIAV